ncbi:MAG: hypothetical protein JO314_13065 [Acidobacteria bacterium]|nr:hypothetical protein [Acidobacteriota bacterium]
MTGTHASRVHNRENDSTMYDPRIWRSRGYLPHIDDRSLVQFITFRLADSMPQNVLEKWREDLENGTISDANFRRRIETYLDQNYGSCALRNHAIGVMVQDLSSNGIAKDTVYIPGS